MVLKLAPELEAALHEAARRQGVAPETLALNVLHERFLAGVAPLEPADDWERRLLAVAKDCGVSLPHSAVSSEGLYEE